jgi:hypothetical protein
MEWFTLDDSLRRAEVIEGFESFVWTERYAAWGDFEILTNSDQGNRSLLQPGIRIGMTGSYRTMTVESVVDEIALDGIKKLTVTGRSMEAILEDRVAYSAVDDLTAKPKWTLTGHPADIMRTMFNTVCVTHALDANDGIPFYTSGRLLPVGSIPEPADTVTLDFDPDSLYNNLVSVATTWPVGFRLIRDGDTGHVYFEVYMGNDRTTMQSVRGAVLFAPQMETISKTATVKSIANQKSVAYVFGKLDAVKVYATGFDATVSGAARRVLMVNAQDIDLPLGAGLTTALTQRGKTELGKNTAVYAYDGEVTQYQPYVYEIDYSLGDLVEEQSPEGFINQLIVTEQIFVSDGSGELSYPTLTLKDVILPGTWRARPIGEHWADVASDQNWDEA